MSAVRHRRIVLTVCCAGLVACSRDFSTASKSPAPSVDAGSEGSISSPSSGTGGASSTGGSAGSSGNDGSSTGGQPPSTLTCGGKTCSPLPPACTGARRCCTPEATCGVTADRVGGVCLAEGQQGGLDDQCPGATFGSTGLLGCCRPDGSCGGLEELCGIGCASAASLGAPAKSCTHDPSTDCIVNGVNRCVPDAGAPPADGGAGPEPIEGGPPVGTYRFKSTTVLAPFVGGISKATQPGIGFHGTDLGYSVVTGSNIRFLFGDTWPDENGAAFGSGADDSQGDVSLALFPDGDAVDAYVAAHPPGAQQLPWQRGGPPVGIALDSLGQTAPLLVYRSGRLLDMGAYKTPVGAFSNGKSVFAVFGRAALTPCSGGTSPTCAGGFTCDTGLGGCAGTSTTGDGTIPCLLTTSRCVCQPLPGGGLCQDRTSSVYDTSEDGRVLSSVIAMDVGNADPTAPTHYYTQPWYTNKFYNPTIVTVKDFDPSRVEGNGDDYRTAEGEPTAREKVFVWGRPGFAGPGSLGRDARLYFAYVDMPTYDATGSFAWAPHYFTGVAAGKPQFSTDQSAAVPLDLSGGANDPTEKFDMVNQVTISWVEPIKQWVMLYGGDLPAAALDVLLGGGKDQVVRDPEGAIHGRFAAHPWGPWSPPVAVLVAGVPGAAQQPAGAQYGAGGILYSSGCTKDCVPSEPSLTPDDAGRLYGAAIVSAWTEARADGADVYWNVSTLNPYGIVLMRTRIGR